MITLPVMYKAATKWVDFEKNTCLPGGWNLPGIEGSSGQNFGEFIGLGTKEDCKKKCVEYNMAQTSWAKEYPCRAIEWSNNYRVEKVENYEWGIPMTKDGLSKGDMGYTHTFVYTTTKNEQVVGASADVKISTNLLLIKNFNYILLWFLNFGGILKSCSFNDANDPSYLHI